MTDSTAIAERPEAAVPAEVPDALSPTLNLAAIIQGVLASPDLPGKMDAIKDLVALHREEQALQAKRAWVAAMNRAQAEVPRVLKTGQNQQTRSRYAKLEQIEMAARPALRANDLSLCFGTGPSPRENWMLWTMDVHHVDGHTERYEMPAPIDDMGPKGNAVKTPLHGLGSSQTYCQKRMIAMALNIEITEDDDDGNAVGSTAAQRITPEQAEHLRTTVTELGERSPGAFLRVFRVDSYDDIPRDRYAEALSMLDQKRSAAKRPAEGKETSNDS